MVRGMQPTANAPRAGGAGAAGQARRGAEARAPGAAHAIRSDQNDYFMIPQDSV
jgi:hypothetical protein